MTCKYCVELFFKKKTNKHGLKYTDSLSDAIHCTHQEKSVQHLDRLGVFPRAILQSGQLEHKHQRLPGVSITGTTPWLWSTFVAVALAVILYLEAGQRAHVDQNPFAQQGMLARVSNRQRKKRLKRAS